MESFWYGHATSLVLVRRAAVLLSLQRLPPRGAEAAEGALLLGRRCHLSAPVPGHRGGCVRHPGATLEGGGKEQ